MYRGVIFDLDGTLLDTTIGVVHAVKKTLNQSSLIKPEYIKWEQFVGPPMQDSFQKYFAMDEEKALGLANIFRGIYRKDSLFMAEVYSGVYELLALLRKNNYKIAVATNKSHENALEILNKFGIMEYCDYAKGSDLDGKLKKTDIINLCMQQLNIKYSELLCIGDSKYDLEGAKKLNIDFLAVTYGFGFGKTDLIEKNECAAVCNTIREIEIFLKLI